MVPTLGAILNIGVTGLRAQQAAISVTSHNIANVNTEGYTRQRASFSEEIPLQTLIGTFGMGVKFAGITRMRQNLLDGNYRAAAGQQNEYDLIGGNARALEGVLGDINGNTIGTGLAEFFNAWHDLTTGPEDLAVRQAVIDKSVTLTDFFHQASLQLGSIAGDLDLQVNASADDINSLTQRIASLNSDIFRAEQGGAGPASDLRDQRDTLLDGLSSYMNLTITEQSNGMVDVSANGEALVTGLNPFAVQVVPAGSPAHPEIRSSANVPLATTSGKLTGLVRAYQDFDSTQTTIDGMAAALITAVNNLHAGGASFDLNGNAGVAFFSGTDAASIAVNPAIIADPRLVAAADTANPGNTGNALKIAQLQDALTYPAGSPTTTLIDAFRNLLVKLGSAAQNADQLAATYGDALNNLKGQRQSMNGVNMDEELSNMIAYQHAYEAAARIVTTVDETMDLIINRMGRVGL